MRRSGIVDGILIGLLGVNTILLFLIYRGLKESPIMSTPSTFKLIESASLKPHPVNNPNLPRIKKAVTPEYPEEARKKGWQGRVIVKATVGVDGLVKSAKVVFSSGHPCLDSAAVEAIKKYTFEPAKDSTGKPVEKWVFVPVIFRLDK